jgi:FHA domain
MEATAPHPESARELQAVLEAERAGTPFLLYRDAGRALVVQPLPEDSQRLTIGRRSQSDVPLPWDDAVSRGHAVMERIGSDWSLVDDGISRNGTYVNGDRLRGRRRLNDRDALRFGSTPAVFRCPPQASSAAVTRPADEAPTPDQLTTMQRKVLVALCRPYRNRGVFTTPATNQEIARELVLSVEAVKTHMRGIFHRLDVDDLPQNRKRARVVELAFQWGLVTERDL